MAVPQINLATLMAQIRGANGSGGSAYDPRLEAALGAAQMGEADLDAQFRRGSASAETGYQQAYHDLTNQRDKAYTGNTNQFAGQGILRSGIFAKAQGDTTQAYQRNLQDAAARRTSALVGLEDSRRSGYSNILQQLMGARADSQARASEAAQQAALERSQADSQARLLAYQQQAQAAQLAALQAQGSLYGATGQTGSTGGHPFDPKAVAALLAAQKRQQAYHKGLEADRPYASVGGRGFR